MVICVIIIIIIIACLYPVAQLICCTDELARATLFALHGCSLKNMSGESLEFTALETPVSAPILIDVKRNLAS